MKNRVCICIPTKDRAEMVQEVLSYERGYYPKYDVDIVYYDSGTDDTTRNVINDFMASGFSNLYYKKMPSDLCIDEKLFRIFREEKDIREYRYIWLINDSVSITEESIKEIIKYADNNYDLIRLPIEGDGDRSDYETKDVNDWFQRCSKGMAHMASTLMSTRLLQGNIDWNELYDKYVVSNDIHGKDHGFFFTVGFYLERILQLEEAGGFRGLLIGNRRKWRRDSPLKLGRSYWDDLAFETWGRSYVETIMKLPDRYTDKRNVIRSSDNIIFGRFERQSLISFRIRGLYSDKEYERYKKYWQYVSTLSDKELLEIARTPVDVLKKEYGDSYGRTDRWSGNLDKIEKDIGKNDIIIYGAGLYGEYAAEKLLRDGYGEKILGIAVSDASQNVDRVCGIQVKDIDLFSDHRSTAVVIIATLPDTARSIEKSLIPKGYENIRHLF